VLALALEMHLDSQWVWQSAVSIMPSVTFWQLHVVCYVLSVTCCQLLIHVSHCPPGAALCLSGRGEVGQQLAAAGGTCFLLLCAAVAGMRGSEQQQQAARCRLIVLQARSP